MKRSRAFVAALIVGLVAVDASHSASAQEAAFDLHPVQVAPDSYAFIGDTHFFSPKNRGDIANAGFIVTGAGVVVIDTGSSRLYGEAMRRAIAKVTAEPVVKVIITHSHPDHFLGTQAFGRAPAVSGAATVEIIRAHGQELAGNLYTLVGDAMRGTEPVVPEVLDKTEETIGRHKLRYYLLSGHTDSDLVVFDKTSGVLYAGDLVFFRRAITVPNANVPRWLASLQAIEAIPYSALVPGHGPVPAGHAAVAQTRDYLEWLDGALRAAVDGGLDITEASHIPVPARFHSLAIVDEEFQRSVGQMYPRLESTELPLITGRDGPSKESSGKHE